jgi:hypothetical protein
MHIAKKTVLITGANRGIGEALVIRCLKISFTWNKCAAIVSCLMKGTTPECPLNCLLRQIEQN